jgi:hypothetical protein
MKPNAKTNTSPDQGHQGWTIQQLALVLMLFGVLAVLAALKCLVIGPPPYSVLAYILGPCLIVASYLVDPHAIGDLVTDALRPREPPAAKDG